MGQDVKPRSRCFNTKDHIFHLWVLLLRTSETLQYLLDPQLGRFGIFRLLERDETKGDKLGWIFSVEPDNIIARSRNEIRPVLQYEFRDGFGASFQRPSTTRTTGFRWRFSVDRRAEKGGLLEFVRLEPFQDICDAEWLVQADLGERCVIRDGNELELGEGLLQCGLGKKLEVAQEFEVLKQESESGFR